MKFTWVHSPKENILETTQEPHVPQCLSAGLAVENQSANALKFLQTSMSAFNQDVVWPLLSS